MEGSLQHKAYGGMLLLLNTAAATSIIFCNKLVLSVYAFKFPYALTLLHTLVTLGGMLLFSSLGFYKRKAVPVVQVVPLAASFVAYVLLWNVCLRVNSVTFFQLSKIMITPGVVILQALLFNKVPSRQEMASIVVLCMGVGLATVSGAQVDTTLVGAAVAIAAIGVTSIYQIWVGSKQSQLQLSSMQLMAEYVPQATLMLMVLVPLMEPLGLRDAAPGSLMAYEWTLTRAVAVAVSSLLGLAVSLTMFLVVGVVGALPYNIVGHIKTVTILLGGFLLFGDELGPRKLMGVLLAMSGILWYSWLQLGSRPAASKPGGKQVTKSRDAAEAEQLLRKLPSAGPEDLQRGSLAEHRLPISKGVQA